VLYLLVVCLISYRDICIRRMKEYSFAVRQQAHLMCDMSREPHVKDVYVHEGLL
jgi:hypothetical protein